jgi:alpha-beta hydrolase superfamily lysophospholipase
LVPRIEHFSAAGGYRCFVRVWDVARPVAQVVCLHGIISHGGWYLHSCRQLAAAGFAVHFLDRRGSGLNAPGRGDVDSYITWLQDVERYLTELPTSPPRILIGISWGGKLATGVARSRPDLVDGLGLLCPGFFARRAATTAQRVAVELAGMLRLQALQVRIPLQDPRLFTASREWQVFIETDPLTLRTVTIRFALADLRLTRWVTQCPASIQAPTLLMLAGQDRIIDNQRVRELVERFEEPANRNRVIEYPDAEHTLEFEPHPGTFVRDLANWIEAIAAWPLS